MKACRHSYKLWYGKLSKALPECRYNGYERVHDVGLRPAIQGLDLSMMSGRIPLDRLESTCDAAVPAQHRVSRGGIGLNTQNNIHAYYL